MGYIDLIYSKNKIDFNTALKKLKYTRIPERFMVKATKIYLKIFGYDKIDFHEFIYDLHYDLLSQELMYGVLQIRYQNKIEHDIFINYVYYSEFKLL